jgi:hypothetical protein
MGLLDDAIREHLDFKRLRGADPSEVAREERAALGPAQHDDDEAPQALEYLAGPDHLAAGNDRSFGEINPGSDSGIGYLDEQTAELDMQMILGGAPHQRTVHPELDQMY